MSYNDREELQNQNKSSMKEVWEAPVLVQLNSLETAGGKPTTLGEGGGFSGTYGAS